MSAEFKEKTSGWTPWYNNTTNGRRFLHEVMITSFTFITFNAFINSYNSLQELKIHLNYWNIHKLGYSIPQYQLSMNRYTNVLTK